MVAMSSPFDSGMKDTTPQSPTGGSGQGAAPSSPPPDYPLNQVQTELGTTGASWDSPYNQGIVQSTSVVSNANPGGTAPCESPFTDGLAKY